MSEEVNRQRKEDNPQNGGDLCVCGEPENSIRHSNAAASSVDAHEFQLREVSKQAVSTITPHGFAYLMERELNANQHKGAWSQWQPDKTEAIEELRHHAEKLVSALCCEDREAITEFSADTANIAMKVLETLGEIPEEIIESEGVIQEQNNEIAGMKLKLFQSKAQLAAVTAENIMMTKEIEESLVPEINRLKDRLKAAKESARRWFAGGEVLQATNKALVDTLEKIRDYPHGTDNCCAMGAIADALLAKLPKESA